MQRFIIYSLLIFSVSVHANVRDTLLVLPEIEVQASLVGGKLKNSSASLSILMDEKLKAGMSSNLLTKIEALPGVFVHQGALNTNRITIRGMGSRTPYGTNRVKAYLDEIPLTTGDGVLSLEDLDPAFISRLEVMKGPSGAMYGSGLGGVIRMYSPLMQKPQNYLKIGSRSFGTSHLQLAGGANSEHSAFGGAVSILNSDGFRANSKFTRESAIVNARHTIGETQLQFTGLLLNQHAFIPSSLNENDFKDNPQNAASNWLAVKGHEKKKKAMGGITASRRLSQSIYAKFTVFGNWDDPYESRPFNILDDQSYALGSRGNVSWTKNEIQLIAGYETFQERYKWKIYETVEGEQGELLNQNTELRRYQNIYGLFNWQMNSRLRTLIAINVNQLNYRLDDEFTSNGDQSASYVYPLVLSPRLATNFAASSLLNLYASVGHGYSAPSLEETLLPGGDINNELKPEQGIQTEIGARQQVFNQKGFVEATVYGIFLNNLLVTKRYSEESFTGINAGKTNHFGVELSGEWMVLNRSSFPGTLIGSISSSFSKNTFLDFVDDGEDYTGKQLPGIPKSVQNLMLNWHPFDILKIRMNYQGWGSQYLNDSNLAEYPSVHLFNFETSVEGLKINRIGLSFEFGVRNLLNRSYASMLLVNAPSFGGNMPRYYYPGNPRNYYFTLRMQLAN